MYSNCKNILISNNKEHKNTVNLFYKKYWANRIENKYYNYNIALF